MTKDNGFHLVIFLVLTIIALGVLMERRKRPISRKIRKSIEERPLKSLKYISLIMILGLGAITLGSVTNIYHPSSIRLAFFGLVALTLLLISLIITDLEFFFYEYIYNEVIYNEISERPNMELIIDQLLSPYSRNMADFLKWIFSVVKLSGMEYNTLGRIFTYISFSTFGYVCSVALVFVALFGTEPSVLSHVMKQALEPPIDWKIVLLLMFFSLLMVIFFAIKESIFQHYTHKLISSKTKELGLDTQKEELINEVCRRLDAIIREETTYISELGEEVELLEKRISYVNQKIKEVEKEFEFHRSLKLTIIVPPISVAVSTAIAGIITWILEIFR